MRKKEDKRKKTLDIHHHLALIIIHRPFPTDMPSNIKRAHSFIPSLASSRSVAGTSKQTSLIEMIPSPNPVQAASGLVIKQTLPTQYRQSCSHHHRRQRHRRRPPAVAETQAAGTRTRCPVPEAASPGPSARPCGPLAARWRSGGRRSAAAARRTWGCVPRPVRLRRRLHRRLHCSATHRQQQRPGR